MTNIMLKSLAITAVVYLVASAATQDECQPAATFHSTSTIVTAPVLVRDRSGAVVTTLGARDFQLYDNGGPQSINLARFENEPIALVLVVQTGENAATHFYDFADLPLYLGWLTGGNEHELMLVTFDSRVELLWHFPVRSDGVAYSLTHLHRGDAGAAIIDAVDFAVQQLQSEPGNFRRIVLFIGQDRDEGSSTSAQEALRTLGKGSTAVYSLTFSPAHSRRKTKSALGGRRAEFLSPLAAALDGMRNDTAAELAAYTGGAHLSFSTRHEFDDSLKAVGDDLRNRNSLSFQPVAHKPGFHELRIEVPIGLTVTGRGGYWFEPVSANP